ncbi:MAG TPA: tripartite tricarboxylate transporter substrate binding protein [Piscinibacter sp.]|jgi:tripartite-type tricarboxylate transporter receptor subunit TctC|uniref:Bug family tripartite tricarboxylate transporter substrate binding protein n=1 Tax=Piscinibacter sp. TaxID=1903157 RepID=UPI001B40F722|nr:tripartite tricarboxylate transporter substrate binding protein [Piscinibacter sp.]MBK7532661.1 tripartite tricarboxylate transporter substrate binding protein [Piscinibacter sp.]MBP6541474.1 tripartite tricarboxylate transporter substrate binding protein [Piscinibacter sp.]HOY35135.1 tripartite tricarboxylate transporter substrate binding protein [Piscinibacter sp.]HPG79796.1 tripartite tricarboxylate transporter substrate binding protein [Piscinibacter sp.]HPM65064.1 tripartite tricarboxy
MTLALPRRALVGLGLVAALSPLQSFAQAWPSKPVRWVVAYPAGGGSDFLARQLSPQLAKQLGQTIVIDNRPGAAGIIGTDNAAKSPPDGYTIVTGDNGAMVFHEAMYKKIPYAPGDLAPVGFMARFPLILAVNPSAGFASGKQLLDDIKKNPGKFSYASPGIGSPHHLAMELLKDRTQAFVVHVPYRGTAMAVQDVIAGQVPMMVLDTAAGLPQIRSGKVKALAVMSKKRIPSLPDVPTLDELGVKDFEVTAWQGLFVPKGTPADIVTRLTVEMNKAIATPEVKARLEDFGLEVTPTDGPALASFLQKETSFWHALIKERKLSAD